MYEEICGKSTQSKVYIQWITTLSLTMRVFFIRLALQLLPPKFAKFLEIL